MARKRGQTIELERMDGATITGEKTENEAVERINEEIEAQIFENLNSGTDDTRWRLYATRITGTPNTKGGREIQLFNIDPAELKIENLNDRLQKYGDGLYRIRVYKNREINTQYDIEIEVPKLPTTPTLPKSDLEGLAGIMREMQRQTMELFSRLETRNAASVAIDPIAMMEKMAATLASLKTLQPEQPRDNVASMIEIFKLGMEARGESEGGHETGVLDIALKLIEKLDLSQLSFAPPAPQTALPAPQTPPEARTETNGTRPAPQQRPPQPSQQSPLAPFAGQLGALVQKAQRGDDPALWGDVLLAEIPEPALEIFFKIPNLIGELSQLNAGVAHHVQWFSDMLASMREQWENSAEVGTDNLREQPELRDTGNAPFQSPGNTTGSGGH